MKVTLAIFVYISSLTLLTVAAVLGIPETADPNKWAHTMLVTSLVQMIAVCYLFAKAVTEQNKVEK
jgi:hypothetical protein